MSRTPPLSEQGRIAIANGTAGHPDAPSTWVRAGQHRVDQAHKAWVKACAAHLLDGGPEELIHDAEDVLNGARLNLLRAEAVAAVAAERERFRRKYG